MEWLFPWKTRPSGRHRIYRNRAVLGREGGLFAMPMAFVVPVTGAGPEWMERLSEVRSLSEYAELNILPE
jgi:hypothetical protein